jgi:hypothetical protein
LGLFVFGHYHYSLHRCGGGATLKNYTSTVLLEFWRAGDGDGEGSGGSGARRGPALVESDPPLDVFALAARGAPPVVETTDDGLALHW